MGRLFSVSAHRLALADVADYPSDPDRPREDRVLAEFENIMRTAAIAGSVVFVLLFLMRVWWVTRTRVQRQSLFAASMPLQLLQVLSVLALILIGYGFLMHLFVVQRGTIFMPTVLQTVFAIVFASYILFEIVVALWPRPRSLWLRAIGALGMAGVGALGLLLTINAMSAFDYPAPEESVILARTPFDGEWAATGAGATGATNHHDRIASQKYAADVAALCEDGRLFRGEGRTQEESCTFGVPVLSPVDGEVVHVLDGLADGASREVLPGNHVVIAFADGRYVALAHLQQDSVSVGVGERVHAGQPIGLAGNSGNSDFPHLHIHVQDRPIYDLREGRAFPYRFAEMERRRFLWWSRVENGALLSNDRIRPAR